MIRCSHCCTSECTFLLLFAVPLDSSQYVCMYYACMYVHLKFDLFHLDNSMLKDHIPYHTWIENVLNWSNILFEFASSKLNFGNKCNHVLFWSWLDASSISAHLRKNDCWKQHPKPHHKGAVQTQPVERQASKLVANGMLLYASLDRTLSLSLAKSFQHRHL